MKRNVISLLLIVALLLALCAGLAEGTAVKRFIDLSGRWVDPNHDRALLKIMRAVEMDVPEDEIWYDVEIAWPDSASEETVWYMSARYDEETTSLMYTDGVKARVTYDANGGVVSEANEWTDSEGALIWANGRLQWADRREDQLEDSPEMRFEPVRREGPVAADFKADYFLPVANLENGTAGSGLKEAALAHDLVRFAFENAIWDANIRGMRDSMLEAWEGLSEEERSRFDENFMGAVVPLLDEAFGGYDAVAGQFGDAGVGDDMAYLAENREARESWQTLLANTLTLGNDDGAAMEARVDEGRFCLYIPMDEFDEGYWTLPLQDESVVRLVSERMTQDGYRAELAPVADGDIDLRFMHMDGIACVEYYDYALTVKDGEIQEPGEAAHGEAIDEWDQDEQMADHWEDPSGLAVMDIAKNGKGYDVEIVAADASGAHVWTMTVYYDCELEAYVYDNGARYATEITDSEDADLGEAEYRGQGGKLYFEAQADGEQALRWFENGDEAEKPLCFVKVRVAEN